MFSNAGRNLGILVAFATLAAAGRVTAAGFYIQEQSAAGLGRAQAGNGVVADDASTIYFNPAGMTQLPGIQTDSGINLIVPSASMSDRGTIDHSPLAPNSLPGGGSGGNPGSASPIPDFFISAQIPDQPVWVGLGVTAPFGFASKYDQNFFGRYDSIDTYLETIDIGPTVAVKLNDWLSFGIGLDEQYAYVKLRSAVPNALAAGGPSIATDGRVTVTGHNWTTGFNGGLLIQATPDTRVGLTYRYGLTHIANTSVTVANLGGLLALANQQVEGTAALDLPDVITAGISQRITPQLTLLGEFDYFTWSNFKSIDIKTQSPTLGELVTPEYYRDTYSFAVGAEYQLDDQWKLRGGVKFDQTPTVNAYRDTRVPDGDRYWLAAGFHYQFDEHIGIDGGYAHIFLTDSSINVSRSYYQQFGLTTTSNVMAESHVAIDILTVGLAYKF